MERIQYEYVAYVWDRFKERYVQFGITLSPTYDCCKKVFEMYRDELQSKMVYDFSDYHIKFRKIVYTDWEVIYE